MTELLEWAEHLFSFQDTLRPWALHNTLPVISQQHVLVRHVRIFLSYVPASQTPSGTASRRSTYGQRRDPCHIAALLSKLLSEVRVRDAAATTSRRGFR